MNPVTVAECSHCGQMAFPQPALCPVCAHAEWHTVEVKSAVVEAVTSSRSANGDIIYVAEARTSNGPIMVVRCGSETERGAVVWLRRRDGTVWAIERAVSTA